MRRRVSTNRRAELAALLAAVVAAQASEPGGTRQPREGDEMAERPQVVTICGSTRFRDEIAQANRGLTLAGCIVLAPGVFAHAGDQITDEQKLALDELHFRKIDLADSVVVVDPGGYVGASTQREIDYARSTGKPVVRTSVMGGV